MTTPLPRLDAADKAAGRARYLGDQPFDGLDGALVTSPIAAGLVLAVHREEALAVPGVVAVWGPGDLGDLAPLAHWAAGQSKTPLMDNAVRYAGQPVVLVLATSRRAAALGAARVRVEYQPLPARVDAAGLAAEAIEIKDWAPSSTRVGSVETGLAESGCQITGRYHTADRHHVALEPAGAIARWHGDHLEIETSTQWVYGVRAALAVVTGLPAEQIRVRAYLVGGGFGAKGSTWPHEILAVLAAGKTGRPVRIILPREQSFTAHGHQPATDQTVTLGATNDGHLTAIRHESVNRAAIDEDYVEHGSLGSRTMYACPNIETRDRILRLHRPQPTFMRAPHEGPGMVGLEIAMDELAVALGRDPVELRLLNYADADPTSGKPFSSKHLRECYQRGAGHFGWRQRDPRPGVMRDRGQLIGWGMASALMSTFRFGATARVTARRDGTLLVETAAHEIGTGVGTMLAIVVAESLGADPSKVEVRLGDSHLPEAGGTVGSATTMGVGSAARLAALGLKGRMEQLAGEPHLRFEEFGEVLKLRQLDHLAEEASWAPKREEGAFAMNAYGAVFVEVRIDPELPIPRVSRCVGAYSVGRIVNPVGARSQIIGGITWGIGQALLEDSRFDPTTGRFLAHGFGSYHIPVNADVPPIDVLFADEHDPHASALGARGVGEIGTIGVGAAIANAVWHATGRRVRILPILVEHLL